jgi:hypothetical protein
VAGLPTAYRAFLRIKARFVGGSNPESSQAWFSMLTRGMLPGESLEQYCAKVENMYTCLLDNGAQVHEFKIMSDLVNGLPEEMDPIKLALHGAIGSRMTSW